MAAFVVVVTVSAAHSRKPAASSFGVGSSSGPGGGSEEPTVYGHAARPGAAAAGPASWDARLAAALRPLLREHTGNLAVGVIDRSTGAVASYGGRRHFHTASIVKADILATLLLQHRQAGTALSAQEKADATAMIEQSDNDAATALWDDIGSAAGLAAANVVLKLTHTVPGAAGYWGLTSTTVVDQLRLLTDLTATSGPLTAASRGYEVGLMERVVTGQAWGVPAAASPGTVSAVKNGWLPDPRLWVINSIGVVHRDGQELLIAVLSNDQPNQAAGIGQVQQAARDAAEAIMSGGR